MVLNIKHRIAEFTSGVALLLHIQNQGGSLEKMGVRPGPWPQLPCWEETAHALGPRRGSVHGCSLFLTSLGYWFSSSPRGTTDVIFTPWCLPIFTIQSVIYDQQHQRHLGTWSECSISASTPRYRSPTHRQDQRNQSPRATCTHIEVWETHFYIICTEDLVPSWTPTCRRQSCTQEGMELGPPARLFLASPCISPSHLAYIKMSNT